MFRTALLVGATGLVGHHVLDLLLANGGYTRVQILVRRPLDITHDKLEAHVLDFERLGEYRDVLRADDVYACLGTTLKVAGTEEKFRRVDHDYSVEVARIARQGGAERIALVSSVGASPNASNFYLRVKGETERDLDALGYPTLAIVRPSVLVGQRAQRRVGEKLGIAVGRALAFAMVGGLRKYRPIEAECVAAAMVAALLRGKPGTTILEHEDILRLTTT